MKKNRTENMKKIYIKYIKRILDIIISLIGIICFFWLYILVSLLVRVKLGKPVIFVQVRPGKLEKNDRKERLFKMYKFRSMINKYNKKGVLLSDEERLTSFGKKLRSTSLDEIPELFNVLKGDMSFVGPRPQLVNDLVFMNDNQRKRHLVKPGITGLAQINGRNSITWEEKFYFDKLYVEKMSFILDFYIVMKTISKVIKKDSITSEGMVTSENYGDYLLRNNKISLSEYNKKQYEAECMINDAFR